MVEESVKRKIRDLRVVDLRNELESRGLDKTGVKATLIDRLIKALQEEGLDPEEYYFETSEKKTVKRTIKHEVDGVSDRDSFTEGADGSNANEFDEEVKEEKEEVKKDNPVTAPSKDPPHLDSIYSDRGINEENNEAVDDYINIKLEDEENFEEENTKEKDEQQPQPAHRRSSNHHRHEDSRSNSSSMGASQSTAAGASAGSGNPVEGGTSTTPSADGTGEQQQLEGREDKESKSMTSATADSSSTTGTSSTSVAPSTSGAEKAKSGSTGGAKDGTKITTKEDRDKKKAVSAANGNSGSSRNLWVSGLASNTRATDLKHVFSKYGKVIGAKVVTNARTPGARCYGYVTMATSEDASKCIQHLHRTELHGRMISVERAKGESGPRKADLKADTKTAPPAGDSAVVAATNSVATASVDTEKSSLDQDTSSKKAPGEGAVSSKKIADGGSTQAESSVTTGTDPAAVKQKDEAKSSSVSATATATTPGPASVSSAGEKDEKDTSRLTTSQQRDMRPNRKDRPMGGPRRPPSPHRPRHQVLTFQQIREMRERQRQREREREEREAERRRREEIARHERKQREEAIRLEKERIRLRLERETLEREKAELLRLERERQRLEREKIEAEREEVKRQQARSLARLEEARRATKRAVPADREDYLYDRKRIAVDVPARYVDQPAPPSRYDEPHSKPGSSGHFGSSSSDYRGGSKLVTADPIRTTGGYDSNSRGNRFERPLPASAQAPQAVSGMTRRVVQEISTVRRVPPSPPPSRDRIDDRRVVDRRDERLDRGNRGRETFVERDRDRERDRPRDRAERADPAMRNRMTERDHRDNRYADSRTTKGNGSDHRFNDRPSETWRSAGAGPVSGSGSKSYVSGMVNNGGGNSGGGSNWSQSGPDRWASASSSSLMPLGRSMNSSSSFTSSSWTGAGASQIGLGGSSSGYPSSGNLGNMGSNGLGQSSSVSYSNDRYSRH